MVVGGGTAVGDDGDVRPRARRAARRPRPGRRARRRCGRRASTRPAARRGRAASACSIASTGVAPTPGAEQHDRALPGLEDEAAARRGDVEHVADLQALVQVAADHAVALDADPEPAFAVGQRVAAQQRRAVPVRAQPHGDVGAGLDVPRASRRTGTTSRSRSRAAPPHPRRHEACPRRRRRTRRAPRAGRGSCPSSPRSAPGSAARVRASGATCRADRAARRPRRSSAAPVRRRPWSIVSPASTCPSSSTRK